MNTKTPWTKRYPGLATALSVLCMPLLVLLPVIIVVHSLVMMVTCAYRCFKYD